jgi:putative lipoprotein
METLSGKIKYHERKALPAGAEVRVRLVDISRRSAPAVPLAEHNFTTTGEQPPLSFRLEYDPKDIKENHDYAIEASITIDGKLAWITPQEQPVFEKEAAPPILIINLIKTR